MAAKLHLNKFGVCVRAGYAVEYHHPRAGTVSGWVARIWFDRWQMPDNSGTWRVKLTSGATCCLDDITKATPEGIDWGPGRTRADFTARGERAARMCTTKRADGSYSLPAFAEGRSWQARAFAEGFRNEHARQGHTVRLG